MKKKTIALLLACVMILGCAIGGTLAWLLDKESPVVNTFTTSDVDIALTETDTENNAKSFQMVPGHTISKDPKVTVLADSEKCYVFVKLDKSANFDSFMEYTMAEGWTKLSGVSDVDNVWYRSVEKNTTANQDFYVIKDNTVKVLDTVTKEDMDSLTSNTYPTLTVTAYACQYNNDNNTHFSPAEAWEKVSGLN